MINGALPQKLYRKNFTLKKKHASISSYKATKRQKENKSFLKVSKFQKNNLQ